MYRFDTTAAFGKNFICRFAELFVVFELINHPDFSIKFFYVLTVCLQVSSPVSKDNASTPGSPSAGCQLNIVGPETAVDWGEKDAAGAVGGVGSSLALPFQLPPRMGMFKNEDWYYGKVFRAQCEILFKYYGDFGDYLIRDSESNVSFESNS